MSVTGNIFDTAPPDERIPLVRKWKQRATAKASAAILPVVKKFARPYVGGETIGEAMCVAERLAAEGTANTIGFWDTAQESGRHVADVAVAAIERLSALKLDGYVSLKPPALRFDAALARELAASAAAHDVRLHCDSHGVEAVERSNVLLEAMAAQLDHSRLGTTLPGRWKRSLDDADWAVDRGWNVRVVKGQWPDPADPARNLSAGFLDVIDALAGRARHVAVATHDLALAREAIGRLSARGTPCEVEVLLGMPARPLLCWARENGVKLRVYVPFGGGFIPNALGVLKRNPRLAMIVATGYLRDAFIARR